MTENISIDSLNTQSRFPQSSARASSGRKPFRGVGGNRSPSAAFTLVELMISAALTAMILVAAYVCLHAALTSQKLIHSRSDAAQTARAALALITADLRAACPLSAEFAFLGMRRTLGDADADNLDFATLNYSVAGPGESDICEISYFLNRDPDTGALSLWRRRDAVPDGEPLSGGSRHEIAGNVRGLRFEYSDGLLWYDDWGDTDAGAEDPDSLLIQPNLYGMPEVVRITLMMESDALPRSSRERSNETPEPPLVFQTVVRLNLAGTAWAHPEL